MRSCRAIVHLCSEECDLSSRPNDLGTVAVDVVRHGGHDDAVRRIGDPVASEYQFVRKWIEERGEGGNHVLPDELTYALQAAKHVESHERGLLEAYHDGQLRLELCFL